MRSLSYPSYNLRGNVILRPYFFRYFRRKQFRGRHLAGTYPTDVYLQGAQKSAATTPDWQPCHRAVWEEKGAHRHHRSGAQQSSASLRGQAGIGYSGGAA